MRKISIIFFISFAITLNLSAQLFPEVVSGRLIRHENFHSAFVEPRNIDIWLPEGYTPENKYAVIYMHDGQMLFDSSTTWNRLDWGVDETLGKLMSEKKVKPCIVVGIWNTPKRHMEYFPQKTLNYLTKKQIDSLMNANRGEGTPKLFEGGIISDNYLKFLVTELKPFIDKTYATHTDSGNTFIMGSSMGGLISMYAICEYPEVFGGAACLSTHWPGVFTVENNPVPGALLSYLREHLPPPGKHLLYFDFGTETLDNLYEPFQNQADQILKDKGYDKNTWITRKFEGADHSEKAWSRRLHIPVMFLLGLD